MMYCTWLFLYKSHTQTTLLKHFHLCLQDTPSQQPVPMPKGTPGFPELLCLFSSQLQRRTPISVLAKQCHITLSLSVAEDRNKSTQKKKWIDGSRVTLYFQYRAYTAFLTWILFGKISVTGLGFKKLNWKNMDRNHTIYIYNEQNKSLFYNNYLQDEYLKIFPFFCINNTSQIFLSSLNVIS